MSFFRQAQDARVRPGGTKSCTAKGLKAICRISKETGKISLRSRR